MKESSKLTGCFKKNENFWTLCAKKLQNYGQAMIVLIQKDSVKRNHPDHLGALISQIHPKSTLIFNHK